MNTLAQVIYHMEHNGDNSSLTHTLSTEENHLLTELRVLLGRTNENLAEWLESMPEPTDWAAPPSIAISN